MTEGRLETVHNLRPENWDNRRHWTNWHHLYDCEEDHIARESAPFHDLRAGGQFQYEYGAGGPYRQPLAPVKVQERPAGDRMDFSKGRGTGIGGGGNVPVDTEPGRPQRSTAPGRINGVHTKKNPLKRGLFSEYEWMPEGEPDAKNKERSGGMKAGGPVNYIGEAHEYIEDPYRDKADHGRIGHFKTGTVKHDQHEWMPEGEAERQPVESYGPFNAGHPAGMRLTGDVEWIPDPYQDGRVKDGRHPFRTWHTRRKWNMPVAAPWRAGLTTAEPAKGEGLDLTDRNLPSLATYRRVNMTHTIGSEAALHSYRQPEPVSFKRQPVHKINSAPKNSTK
ncbi:hypothetical protein STCU_06849 [Strigomonas culicis]|uniref:Uncharacterized protein n=1 Tax=Strigomonas culicis TaxID=28005 RepID=S9U2L1_9TRYP|nr:hypothetical protein STCU_07924 [Strigomonas culicis]EPY25087.1 hypothetical protein STCU_06849 [Strigomonas culicis]|eukprot:EPY23034.1 hypothetical protein STCU_07924 [Strigomonas culicis]